MGLVKKKKKKKVDNVEKTVPSKKKNKTEVQHTTEV